MDFVNEICSCNCEMYHFVGTCCHTKLYSMVEFGTIPEASIQSTNGVDLNEIKKFWKEYGLVCSIFSDKSDEKSCYSHLMFESSFP